MARHRSAVLNSGKNHPRALAWLGEDLYVLDSEADRLRVHSLQNPQHSWTLPPGHRPSSRSGEWREDCLINYGNLLYFNQSDNHLWQLPLAEGAKAFAVHQTDGSANCPSYHPLGGYLWLEAKDEQPYSRLRWLPAAHSEKGQAQTLMAKHQYMAQLRWLADGQACILMGWDEPRLPFEADYLYLLSFSGDKAVSCQRLLGPEGKPLRGIANLLPLPDNSFVCSARWADGERLLHYQVEKKSWRILGDHIANYSRSPWQRFEPVVAYLPSRASIFAISRRQGNCQLEETPLHSPAVTSIHPRLKDMSFLACLLAGDHSLALSASSWQQSPSLLHYRPSAESFKFLGKTKQYAPSSGKLSAPIALCFANSDQGPSYGWFYPPSIQSKKPAPLLVPIHGGPYQEVYANWPLKAHYFNQLGYGVAYFNFRGSSGHGYHYAKSLETRWGDLDCLDILAGIRELIGRGLADPQNIILWGGGVAAYTALKTCLAAPELIRASIIVYGLWRLASRQDQISSSQIGYFNRLLSSEPNALTKVKDSDILERLNTPLAIFHGQKDTQVPWQDSATLRETLLRKKIPCFWRLYPDLGHDWSDRETLLRYYKDIEEFLAECAKKND